MVARSPERPTRMVTFTHSHTHSHTNRGGYPARFSSRSVSAHLSSVSMATFSDRNGKPLKPLRTTFWKWLFLNAPIQCPWITWTTTFLRRDDSVSMETGIVQLFENMNCLHRNQGTWNLCTCSVTGQSRPCFLCDVTTPTLHSPGTW